MPSFRSSLLSIPRSIGGYFSRVCSIFTTRFVIFLLFSQCIIKGGLLNLTRNTMLPLFKNGHGIDASRMQLYVAITMLPWAVKPIIGLLSDLIAIRGYHKKYWLLQSILIGTLCGALLFPATGISTVFLIMCFTGIQYEIACCDLLSESKYSEIMQANPSAGTDCNVLVMGYQMIGSMIVYAFVGTLADEKMFGALFSITLVMAASPFIPGLLGWLPEGRVGIEDVELVEMSAQAEKEEEECDEEEAQITSIVSPPCFYFSRPQFQQHKKAIGVIAFVGLSAIGVIFVVAFASRFVGLVVSGVALICSIVGAFLTMPKNVAIVALYMVVIGISHPVLGSVLDYWYTADETCVSGGPHFSYAYYITYSMLVGTGASLLGTVIYQLVLSKWTFRNVLVLTPILSAVISLSDIVILKRWNITYLHIPDKWAYIVGEAVVEPAIGILYAIPSSALLSKAVPQGMESSAFAMLAGVSNFSGMIAELMGAAIFDAAGVVTVPPGCNFEPLWWLVLICHVMVPVVMSVAAALLLIPNIKQDQSWNYLTLENPH